MYRKVGKMSKNLKPSAPRFHALFSKRENRNIMIMNRKTLEDTTGMANNTEINLSPLQFRIFPIESIQEDAKVIAATLRRTGNEYKLTIYRYDPNDPVNERINTDEYTAWAGLPVGLPRDEMIIRGSTAYDKNFQNYENDFVFIKKVKHGKDHHLESLPENVIPFNS
jgi:hypothetical protein